MASFRVGSALFWWAWSSFELEVLFWEFITLDPSSASSSIACYASFLASTSVYKEGAFLFPIHFLLRLLVLTWTFLLRVSYCASSCPVPSTIDPITIKVSGGTVQSFVVDIDPVVFLHWWGMGARVVFFGSCLFRVFVLVCSFSAAFLLNVLASTPSQHPLILCSSPVCACLGCGQYGTCPCLIGVYPATSDALYHIWKPAYQSPLPLSPHQTFSQAQGILIHKLTL